MRRFFPIPVTVINVVLSRNARQKYRAEVVAKISSAINGNEDAIEDLLGRTLSGAVLVYAFVMCLR